MNVMTRFDKQLVLDGLAVFRFEVAELSRIRNRFAISLSTKSTNNSYYNIKYLNVSVRTGVTASTLHFQSFYSTRHLHTFLNVFAHSCTEHQKSEFTWIYWTRQHDTILNLQPE